VTEIRKIFYFSGYPTQANTSVSNAPQTRKICVFRLETNEAATRPAR
jgi:hypothetical protein